MHGSRSDQLRFSPPSRILASGTAVPAPHYNSVRVTLRLSAIPGDSEPRRPRVVENHMNGYNKGQDALYRIAYHREAVYTWLIPAAKKTMLHDAHPNPESIPAPARGCERCRNLDQGSRDLG